MEGMGALVRLIERFPPGSIWQTSLVSLPLTVAVATFVISHSKLPYWERTAWFFFGLFVWTLLEYLLHRWFLHHQPKSAVLTALLKRLHIQHHENPRDQSQVCIPVILQVPVWFLLYVVVLLAGGHPDASLIAVSGIAVLMVAYDIVHFAVHYLDASNPFFKALKKHHMLHHFSDHTKRFGVTSRFWDRIFGTPG
jgi:sterol desaturase/sphingolipid hydroxylase (fatty acid hydroxylase superfamily)